MGIEFGHRPVNRRTPQWKRANGYGRHNPELGVCRQCGQPLAATPVYTAGYCLYCLDRMPDTVFIRLFQGE